MKYTPCCLLLLSLSSCGEKSADTGPNHNIGGSAGSPSPSTQGGASGDASSAGGSGGIGGAAGSTSDRTRGAISLNFLSPVGCSMVEQFYDLPPVDGGHPVTAMQVGELLEDGGTSTSGEPAEVLCTWFSSTEPYLIDFGITLGPLRTQRRAGLNSQFEEGMASIGSASLTRLDVPGTYGPDTETPCVFNVIELDPVARSIWGSFRCDVFGTSDGSDVCAAGESFFYVENCQEP